MFRIVNQLVRAGRPLRLALLLAAALAIAGCRRGRPPPSATGRTPVRIGWIGLVCEAPLFAAYENGYFADEGLDAQMVKSDWDSFQAGMSFERFDATHTLVAYLLKPIEQGLDVKITGGVHHGCLAIQAGVRTDIRRVEDLRGRRIAVSTMGGPPMVFASRVLSAHGIDPRRDVTWVVYPGDSTQLALDRGRVDAVADSEPIGSLLLNHGCVRTVSDQMVDLPYRDEFCCAVVIGGPLARRDPATAARLTRAILRGAKWVGANPRAAAEIEVRRRYVAKADVGLNAAVLTKLLYAPGVASCRAGLDVQTAEMKAAGMLNSSTDPADLARRAWLDLAGVTDQWVRDAPVSRVAGAGPVILSAGDLAQLAARPPCCNKCCFGG